MSTAPVTAPAEPHVRARRAVEGLRDVAPVVIALLLGVAGLFAIRSACDALWAMWISDPLKSVGGLIPIVSLILILRAWRSRGWEMDGSWWGLALLAVTIGAVHVRDQAVIELVLSPAWSIVLPPLSLSATAYTAGFVLLFGGARLLRGAWFPVALMWFVNPVPHYFNRYIDLPLQHASAMVARSFAHTLGQALTPDQLSLMFTPKFGMFIAPGCNGIRGAITMGFIALVAGYVYRLRVRHWALLTGAAVLLGYGFNFVRLCGLVLYYVLALRYPWMQERAALGDYILGACLFFGATMLLFAALLRWRREDGEKLCAVRQSCNTVVRASRGRQLDARFAAFALLVCVGSVSYARAALQQPEARSAFAGERGRLPHRVGAFTLQREWDESLMTGAVLFHWAEYRDGRGGPAVAIGVSPTLGAHDTLICHAARGEVWSWHGPLDVKTAGRAATLSASLFNDGGSQYLEASTICAGGACNQTSTGRVHFGLIYSRPVPHALLLQNPERPMPVLLRAEIADAAVSQERARRELTQSLTDFLAGADLGAFTSPYRQR